MPRSPHPLPPVLSRVVDPGEPLEARLLLELGPDLLAFQGHFPGFPILPGVVQVDWAIRFGEELFGPLGSFEGMEQLKFLDLVRPGERPELHLAFDPDRGRLRFVYQEGDPPRRKSAGTIRFAPAPGSP